MNERRDPREPFLGEPTPDELAEYRAFCEAEAEREAEAELAAA